MTTITTGRTFGGWLLWLGWTLTSAAGLILLMFIALPIGYGAGEAVMRAAGETIGIAVTGAVFGMAIGLGLGLPQAFMLRQYIARVEHWALASLLGGGVGGAVSLPLAFMLFGQTETTAVFGFSLMGLCISLAQWLVIRGQITSAGWWIFGGTIGIAAGLVVGVPLGGEGRELLSFSVTGLLIGVFTGGAMLWQLRGRRA